MHKVKSEDETAYLSKGTIAKMEKSSEDAVIAKALQILEGRLRVPGVVIDSPDKTRQYLTLQLAEREHEVFCVLYLDNRHRVIEFEEMFNGCIDGCSVHPAVVMKGVLKRNAAAVIFAHNHPSGDGTPSRADKALMKRLSEALALIDVRILDSMIVGGTEVVSMAERGDI